MPLQGYGVLTAKVVDRRREGGGDTPHYQVHLIGDDGTEYRAAVNVKSQQAPSDLLYLLDDDFRHPLTAAVDGLGAGWHALSAGPGGPNLDYVRANLFDAATMRPLPPDAEGPATTCRICSSTSCSALSPTRTRGCTRSASAGGQRPTRRTRSLASCLATAYTTCT